MHHKTAEFVVCVVPNSSIALSKLYTKGTSDEAVLLQFHSLDVLLMHTNIMSGKGCNHFWEGAPAYICPLR